MGDGRNESVTLFGHKMHQLVASSPDILFGPFFVKTIVTMQEGQLQCTSKNAYIVVPGMQFYQMSS
jgi:hypothetical protein